jgi:hypothetical protein
MPVSNNTIFRSKTIQKYIQNREKSVLPRVIAPPVFLLCWLILMLLIAAGIAVWLGQVPVYVSGAGAVLDQHTLSQQTGTAVAVIFLPVGSVSRLHAGLPIQLQIGQSGPVLHTAIDTVERTPLSPQQVRQQYGLQVPAPSCVVIADLGSAFPAHLYAGSLVQAQIQIGSESLLSLFPVLNSLLHIR